MASRRVAGADVCEAHSNRVHVHVECSGFRFVVSYRQRRGAPLAAIEGVIVFAVVAGAQNAASDRRDSRKGLIVSVGGSVPSEKRCQQAHGQYQNRPQAE